jgi:hypothetical protein
VGSPGLVTTIEAVVMVKGFIKLVKDLQQVGFKQFDSIT